MTLAIGTIRAEPVLYYDPDFADQCYEFCTKRDLDALPGVDGASQIWIRQESGFLSEDMPTGRLVTGDLDCFDAGLPDLFERFGVLFVRSGVDLVGAVHWSDYNHPAVASELFDLISAYERALRDLAIQMGLNEGSLIGFLESGEAGKGAQGRVKSYQRMRCREHAAPEFHITYLGDLQALVNAHSNLGLNIESVRQVRNATMHSKEFVHKIDRDTPDFVYDIGTFQQLFNSVVILRRELRRVANRANLVGGLRGIGEPR